MAEARGVDLPTRWVCVWDQRRAAELGGEQINQRCGLQLWSETLARRQQEVIIIMLSGHGGVVGERGAKREEGESSKRVDRSISSLDADEMDSIARRCKQNSRAASRPQSRPFDAEGLARLRHTIRSVQQCTNEASQGGTSNATKERLESAQRDCMSACLNAISSRGEEPGDILKAARIFVGKISSTYTDEEIECVKTIREDAARCMGGYEHRRYSQDRRKHRGRGKANGKGKLQDVQVVINTGGGLKLFVVHTSRQVAIEVQVLLRQVILRAESAQQSNTRHARIDVNGGAASALAAPSRAGGETASGGINSGIDSNTARQAREGSNQGSSGAAAAGPNGGGGSVTSTANEAHDNPPSGNTVASWFVLGNKDIMRYLAKFVDQDQYLFIAPVSKAFRRAWGPRATVTRPVVADTSVTQLTYCLELGLPSTIRQATICNAAARFGRLHLLKLAQESACGWTPATCAQAARGGHLETLQWLRAEGCDWDEKTCQLAVLGGHFRVLKWVRSPTENWPTHALGAHRRAPKLPMPGATTL
ncbi:unnamed protein product [Ectocarpus sp. 12 AP-2014]